MKVLIHSDAAQAVSCVTGLMLDRMQRQPASVLGLATGATMEAVYEQLIAAQVAGQISFSRATSVNLDEYVGLSPTHPGSYWRYMQHHLFDHIDMPVERAHLPRGDAADPAAEAARYEAAIVAAGDIGFQLLGLGSNGHIGFNEPGSSLASLSRVTLLTKQTRRDNARFFESADEVPTHAITQGLGTILRARRLVLVAFGEAKALVVAAAVEGPLTTSVPASALQLHPHSMVIVDEAAASQLANTEYYREAWAKHHRGEMD